MGHLGLSIAWAGLGTSVGTATDSGLTDSAAYVR